MSCNLCFIQTCILQAYIVIISDTPIADVYFFFALGVGGSLNKQKCYIIRNFSQDSMVYGNCQLENDVLDIANKLVSFLLHPPEKLTGRICRVQVSRLDDQDFKFKSIQTNDFLT